MSQKSPDTKIKTVLHVGCGADNPNKLHKTFRSPEWKEIRLDIEPEVKPDIVANIIDMTPVQTNSVDALYSSHNIEHLFDHEVIAAFKEFFRVLKPGGFVLITAPDLQKIGHYIAEGKLDEKIYDSPAGPISAIDILYGHRKSIAGGFHYMAHKTGFTPQRLTKIMNNAGFQKIKVTTPDKDLDLWGIGYKPY